MFWVVPAPIIKSANNCIYSICYLSHRYCYLPLSWRSWRFHPKHVEEFPDINKQCNVASSWIYIGIYILEELCTFMKISQRSWVKYKNCGSFREGIETFYDLDVSSHNINKNSTVCFRTGCKSLAEYGDNSSVFCVKRGKAYFKLSNFSVCLKIIHDCKI
jgi:hypothetical protein